MDEPFLSEISQSQEDKYYMIPLIRGTWRSRLTEIETRMLGTKTWVGRKWGVAVYWAYSFSFGSGKTSGVEWW